MVGATGVVGETILRVLEERRIPIAELGVFASRARANAVRFEERLLDVDLATDAALEGYDVVFFAGGEDASERFVPALLQRGAVVIDNSSTFRMDDRAKLVVPEVNGDTVDANDRLFPVANCTAIILCMALAPIARTAGLRAVRVATYQAASGAGRAGLDELLADERAVFDGLTEPPAHVFPHHLARNVVPQIGQIDADGFSGEERKVREETRKMLALPELFVSATAVRVPVRTAHSEAVFFETARDTSVAELATAFGDAPGVVFHAQGVVTPRDVEGSDLVHVARLRAEDKGSKREFALWCVGDQLRKGAAANGVQILQLLIERGFFQS